MTALYVSPDLRHWIAEDPSHYAEQVDQIDDDGHQRAYRRLDAVWYLWLRQICRVIVDQHGAADDRVASFRWVHWWAIQNLGLDALRAARIPRGYAAPAPRRLSNAS